MKPIVKWAGGKSRLLPEILARVPDDVSLLVEPFCGGAAVFFALEPPRALLSDACEPLIHAYRMLAFNADAVIELLEFHADRHGPAHYDMVRDAWNRDAWGRNSRSDQREAGRAATFLYLNRAGFNGLWRTDAEGNYNVPFGRAQASAICQPTRLRAAAAQLARAELRCCDWRRAVTAAGAGDVIYLDPPYLPVGGAAPVTYGAPRFDWAETIALAEEARAAVGRGAHVIASAADHARTRELWSDLGFAVESVSCSRPINSNPSGRGAVGELLMTDAAWSKAMTSKPKQTQIPGTEYPDADAQLDEHVATWQEAIETAAAAKHAVAEARALAVARMSELDLAKYIWHGGDEPLVVVMSDRGKAIKIRRPKRDEVDEAE